jgi:2-isopropylmalate synthase
VAKRAEALGQPVSGPHLAAAFAGFKARADEIGEINDHELLAIIEASRPDAAPRQEYAYAAAG